MVMAVGSILINPQPVSIYTILQKSIIIIIIELHSSIRADIFVHRISTLCLIKSILRICVYNLV